MVLLAAPLLTATEAPVVVELLVVLAESAAERDGVGMRTFGMLCFLLFLRPIVEPALTPAADEPGLLGASCSSGRCCSHEPDVLVTTALCETAFLCADDVGEEPSAAFPETEVLYLAVPVGVTEMDRVLVHGGGVLLRGGLDPRGAGGARDDVGTATLSTDSFAVNTPPWRGLVPPLLSALDTCTVLECVLSASAASLSLELLLICALSTLRFNHWLPTITVPPGLTTIGECGLEDGLSASTGTVLNKAAVSGPSSEPGTGDAEGLLV